MPCQLWIIDHYITTCQLSPIIHKSAIRILSPLLFFPFVSILKRFHRVLFPFKTVQIWHHINTFTSPPLFLGRVDLFKNLIHYLWLTPLHPPPPFLPTALLHTSQASSLTYPLPLLCAFRWSSWQTKGSRILVSFPGRSPWVMTYSRLETRCSFPLCTCSFLRFSHIIILFAQEEEWIKD